MGREIKRVALNYEFKLGEVWPGFINPHYKECPHCMHGSTTGGKRLEDLVSLIMLSGDDAREGRAHPYFYNAPLYNTSGRMVLSPDIADLTEGLAGRKPSFMGHDVCDKWTATKKIIAAAGLPADWGICPHCKGDAIDPEIKEVYEAWKETPPPSGPGYQLWSTTTEGTPMTPVFDTPEGLAHYCATEKVSSLGDTTENYETWLKFINGSGWAVSAIMKDGHMESGVAAAIQTEKVK